MAAPDRFQTLARMLSEEIQAIPPQERQEFRYLLGRLAVEIGAMEMVNDELPTGGMRLVLREPVTGRSYVADRPARWTPEEEERRLAEFSLQPPGRTR